MFFDFLRFVLIVFDSFPFSGYGKSIK